MTKEMIISSNGHETMVAILEDDLVAEVFVERERHRGVVGNVYKGRVSKVLPGMQSSFIDIGLERDGFLYVADVIDTLEEFEKLAGDDESDGKGGGDRRQNARARAQAKIEELLKRGTGRSSCRSSRSRSAPKAPASPRTSPWPAASWSSCRRSTTSASPARSSRARSGAACAASSASSARPTASPAA